MKTKNRIKHFLNPNGIIEQTGVAEGETIADLGCGSGHFVIPMAKKVGAEGEVLGIDIQEKPLEALVSSAKLNFLYNIKTARADLEKQGFLAQIVQNKLFDKVFISNILFANQEKENIIQEAISILKPGGELIVVDWIKSGLPMAPDVSLVIDPEEVVKICEENGLRFIKNIEAGEYHWGRMFKKNTLKA